MNKNKVIIPSGNAEFLTFITTSGFHKFCSDGNCKYQNNSFLVSVFTC